MKIVDANEKNFTFNNYDIAIIGAGIVGVFLAFLLRNSKYKIILIDRGNEVGNHYSEKRVVNKGIFHKTSQSSSGLVLGGKSSLWGGQLSEFRKQDIEKNFWGFKYTDLQKLYNETYKILNVNCNNNILYKPKYKINLYYTYFLRNPNLFRLFKKKLVNSKNILIVSNLIAQKLVFEKNKAKLLKCKNYKNDEIILNAKKFIFCMGTIECIRFFLTNRLCPRNNPLRKLKLIGYFFHDHISIIFGRLYIISKAKFLKYFENRNFYNLIHQPKICNILNKKAKLSMCMELIADTSKNKSAEKSKHFLKQFWQNPNIKNFIKLCDFKILRYTLIYILHYIRFKKVKLFFKKSVKANIISEQIPLINSKIVINNKILKDGLNQAVLHWKIHGKEFYEIKIFITKLIFFFKRSRIGNLIVRKNLSNNKKFTKIIDDTNHASGGLIISKNSKTGVCNKNFKMWGTSNLYVLSSALFPNSGHSNITLTLLALTLKMKKNLFRS